MDNYIVGLATIKRNNVSFYFFKVVIYRYTITVVD